MTRPLLLLLLLATPVAAQDADALAYQAILPMLQEVAPGRQGEVLAACVLQAAEPAEKAEMAAAAGPTAALSPTLNAILARPATLSCVQAAASG